MKDPGVEEVRRARHEISAEHGHDLHRVVEYYKQVEQELRTSGRFKFEEVPSSERLSGDKLADQSERAVG